MQIQSTFDHAIHHLTPYPTDPKDIKTLQEFRDVLQNSGSDLYLENVKWCTDLQLVRFLVARKYNIQQAHEMIMIALEWRSLRQPDQVEQSDGWAERIETEIITGKIYLPGKDQYDRPIIVLDNTAQNTTNQDNQMVFTAWCLEMAIREMPEHTDKYLIFIHLENFSLFNNPTMSAQRETIKMLCDCFPERLGIDMIK